MSDTIELGRRGRIREGRWSGQSIFIEDDRQTTGGFLVLLGSDAAGENAGDIWVEADGLAKAFAEAAWVVEWEDTSIGQNEPVIDLDAAAKAIEARRSNWERLGFHVGQLTWRDQARGWPWQLVSRDRAVQPDSVGFRLNRGVAEGGIVLFDGGWADVEWWDGTTNDPEVSAPDIESIDAFAAFLDGALARWRD
jgi:hypothetical protein